MFSALNQLCTATAPGSEKHCTMMAKTTPYPPCTGTVIWLAYRRVPGQLPVASSGNAYYHNRRAVMHKPKEFPNTLFLRMLIKYRKLLSLIIVLFGIWILIGGTSSFYQKKINKTIKEKGQKYEGTLKFKDCRNNSFAIFDIDGYLIRIDLKKDCNKYEVGDRIDFYGYKLHFVLETEQFSNLLIYSQLIIGVILILTGVILVRIKMASA